MSVVGHQPPPIFERGPGPLVRLLVLVGVCLVLLVADARLRYLDVVRQVLTVLVYPLQTLAAAPANLVRNSTIYFATLVTVQLENADLRREQLDAAQRLLRFDDLERENQHLRNLLGMSAQIPVRSLAADILYNARDPYTRKVIIDRGLQHDVEAGLAVLDERGVVGQVTRVYPIQSEVTLVTDKSAAIAVRNVRNGLPGVLYGLGENQLEMRFQLSRVDVEPGDRLVTSGLDGMFVAGLPVATVHSVEREGRAFARILATPEAAVSRIGQVLVMGRAEPPPNNPMLDSEPTTDTSVQRRLRD